MIQRDAEPIAHHSPRPPIEICPRYKPEPAQEKHWVEVVQDSVAATYAKIKADQIWSLVVQSCEGRGVGVAPAAPDLEIGPDYAPSEYVAPAEDVA